MPHWYKPPLAGIAPEVLYIERNQGQRLAALSIKNVLVSSLNLPSFGLKASPLGSARWDA